jgi:hypothetical protein
MAQVIETGSHKAIAVPGTLHGRQILRLGQLIQRLIDENGGWGILHLELRAGDIHTVRIETSELFSPERLQSTA